MILRAAMASNLISRISRRRFLTKARLNLKRAICGPCLHTDMSLAALDRLGNRHRPNCSDAARGSLPDRRQSERPQSAEGTPARDGRGAIARAAAQPPCDVPIGLSQRYSASDDM